MLNSVLNLAKAKVSLCVDGMCRSSGSFAVNSPDHCSLGPNVTLITLNAAGLTLYCNTVEWFWWD